MEVISKELRKMSILLSHMCADGNLPSAFSCQDVIWVLYDKIMHWTPETALSEDRDFFIISKGQATLALLPVFLKKGFFKMSDVEGIGSFESRFSNQVDVTKFAGGYENSAGSLGHGLPFAAGIAMANKIKKIPSKVFVLTGDGEFCEGSMWETCLFAAAKQLDNLYVIVDDNNSVGAMIDIGKLDAKLEAFGFDVYVVDGHNVTELELAILKSDVKNNKPKAVIAKTVRGYGSQTLMEKDVWYHKAPNTDELDMLSREVDSF